MTESILEEAQRLIHGERNKNYGHPRENFTDIAALFSGYLGVEVSDIDVANLMILVKIARVKGTGYHRGSLTDIAGYAGCVERIYEEPHGFEVEMAKMFEGLVGATPSQPTRMDTPVSATVRTAEQVLGGQFGPPLEQEPRRWDSLEDVPTDVQVVDRDGDVWTYFEQGGWGFMGYPSSYGHQPSKYDCNGPFTARLDG